MGAVNIDRRDDGIARVAINRTEKRNALNDEVRHTLIAELPGLLRDDAVHALTLEEAAMDLVALRRRPVLVLHHAQQPFEQRLKNLLSLLAVELRVAPLRLLPLLRLAVKRPWPYRAHCYSSARPSSRLRGARGRCPRTDQEAGARIVSVTTMPPSLTACSLVEGTEAMAGQ